MYDSIKMLLLRVSTVISSGNTQIAHKHFWWKYCHWAPCLAHGGISWVLLEPPPLRLLGQGWSSHRRGKVNCLIISELTWLLRAHRNTATCEQFHQLLDVTRLLSVGSNPVQGISKGQLPYHPIILSPVHYCVFQRKPPSHSDEYLTDSSSKHVLESSMVTQSIVQDGAL